LQLKPITKQRGEKTMSELNDWSGEAGQELEGQEISDHVILPVGIKKDGQLYRELYIEQMCGIDDHNIASKARNKNGSVAVSLVLCRCIQEIPGLLARKTNSEKMFDRALARAMCVPDRDYVLSRIYMLSGQDDAIMAGECQRCERAWEEDVKLSELPIIAWNEDKPWEISFKLNRGFAVNEGGETIFHKEGNLRFPTGKDVETLGNISNMAEAVDAIVAACITKVGDLSSVDQEMVKRLTSLDRQELMTSIQNDLPGMRQWKEVRCQCGATVEVRLDLSSFLNVRRRKTKK
jgi:hypothetical protein